MKTPVIWTTPKSIQEIGNEWDNVALTRHLTIEKGEDISFSSVTAPCILRHIQDDKPSTVIDVGCGSGTLSFEIAKRGTDCIGIDISTKSIDIAKEKYVRSNLQFFVSEISSFRPNTTVDACVANMVFMSDPNWIESITHLYNLLPAGGALYITLTHPCFWARYWGFENEEWFDYSKELFLESDFSISLKKNMGRSTYIHRPLTTYVNGLLSAGYTIDLIEEPFPVFNLPPEYEFLYPRFLFIKCKKTK